MGPRRVRPARRAELPQCLLPEDAGTPMPGRVWAGTATVRTPIDIDSVLRVLLDAMQRTRFSSTEIQSVQLAVHEAIVNAIAHGHGGDPTKQVRIRYLINPLGLLAEVEDEGAGFRRDGSQEAGKTAGRGLRLIRQHMTEVRYNACGNCVTLIKRRGIGDAGLS